MIGFERSFAQAERCAALSMTLGFVRAVKWWSPASHRAVALLKRCVLIIRYGSGSFPYERKITQEEYMAFKHSAFVAFVAVPAFLSAGIAIAEDAKWAAPNVAGQPGYKEPPKVDEVHAPRPVKADPRYGGSYQVKHTEANR